MWSCINKLRVTFFSFIVTFCEKSYLTLHKRVFNPMIFFFFVFQMIYGAMKALNKDGGLGSSIDSISSYTHCVSLSRPAMGTWACSLYPSWKTSEQRRDFDKFWWFLIIPTIHENPIIAFWTFMPWCRCDWPRWW